VTLARLVRDLIKERPELSGLWQVASEPIDKLALLDRVNRRFGLGHELVPDDSVRIDRSLDDTPFRSATGSVRPTWDALVEELAADYATLPYADAYAAAIP
jgi:dTDP-4-dehydrorhamnose reductase